MPDEDHALEEEAFLEVDGISDITATSNSSTVVLGDPLSLVEKPKSTTHLILSTAVIGGLQVAWSVELASISPFLLSLGLNKSFLALIWIAGPLSGTVVQPYVGVRSDNCRIQWGRRKPFMIWGAIATILSLLALSWTKELVETFMAIFGVNEDSISTATATQAFALLVVYVLDFSINIIQAAIRAFIVDCAPMHQQEDANSWASRISGFGNIIGYLSGYVYLPEILPWLGVNQFKALVLITCFIIGATLAISCLSVRERDPRLLGPPPLNERQGILGFFQAAPQFMRRLPPQIRHVCFVQIFAWTGWFPFLFYTSTYIGGIYAEKYFETRPDLSMDEIDEIWERGTRMGNFSLLLFAITSFIASVIFPLVVTPTYREAAHIPKSTMEMQTLSIHGPTSPSEGRVSDTSSPTRDKPQRAKSRFTCSLAAFRVPSLTLRRAWFLSHLSFAALMWLTLFVRTTTSATLLIALVGFPWAITNWVPYALIATEISKLDTAFREQAHPPVGLDAAASIDADASGTHANRAGLILGIHNVAIAAPQIVATMASSLVFSALQKPRGVAGDESVAWVLRLGGLCALAAAWASRRVADRSVGN